MKARSGIAQAAALVTVLTALSAVLGFFRDVVIAGVFGAGAELDAYLVAQGLMNLVLALVAGAMAKATVPVLAAQNSADDNSNRAAHTLSVVLTVTLLVLGLGSLIMALAANSVVTVLAPGFKGAQADLAASLTRIVLIATVLISGTNLLAAAAEAHRRFFWSAMQGVPFNVIMIAAAVLFGPRYGVYALAVGFVVGSAGRLLCQLPPIRALGLRLRASFDIKDPGFRSIARLIPPLLLGSALGNANTMVDRAVGSMVGEGTISALSYAWRIISLGETLLVASLLTALYPAFGAAAGSRDMDEMRHLVSRGLATVVTVLMPVWGFMIVCAVPMVALLFEHGSFTPADTQRTATAMLWYAPALLALGWREMVVRASYALGDSRRPVLVFVFAMSINVIGDFTLGLRFGIAGLAASTSLSVLFAAVANTWLLGRRHGAVDLRSLPVMVGRTAIAAAVGTAAGAVVYRLLAPVVGTGLVSELLLVSSVGLTLLGVFIGILYALRAPERRLLTDAIDVVARRRR
ncbi:MAG TPA: murein biosynthesis integral membrane protein MurJ [Propionibacteriaceae bacterium]|nr:murein biosynthesis integral membrane protein MurJ [Propionibacteriaceae bacterium]